MPGVEVGILYLAPNGYVLAEDGEKFGGNTRIFAVTCIRGKTITHWANAVSTQDGKRSFLEWFKLEYRDIVPPFRGKVYIFKKKAPSLT